MKLLLEGQTGEAWQSFGKQMLFRQSGSIGHSCVVTCSLYHHHHHQQQQQLQQQQQQQQ